MKCVRRSRSGTGAKSKAGAVAVVGAALGLTLVLALLIGACDAGSSDSVSSRPASNDTSLESEMSTAPSEPESPSSGETESTGVGGGDGGTGETTTVSSGESTTVSSAEATTTSSSLPQTTSTTQKLISGETRLDDGKIKVMGFIDRVWESGGKRWLRIDYAEFLTGDEAREAAIKAGQLSPGEELPNDYFIRNESHTLREYQVSSSVRITTSTWHGEQEFPVTWEQFKAFWSDSPPDADAAFLKDSPWWIIRDGSLVVRIDEQYLP